MATIDPDVQAAIDALKTEADRKIGEVETKIDTVEKKVDDGFKDVSKSLKELLAATKAGGKTTSDDESDECKDTDYRCPKCTDGRCFKSRASIRMHWRAAHPKDKFPEDIKSVGETPAKKSTGTKKSTGSTKKGSTKSAEAEYVGPITKSVRWLGRRMAGNES